MGHGSSKIFSMGHGSFFTGTKPPFKVPAFQPYGKKLKYFLGLPKLPGTKNFYELFLNDMIPFEIFKSVEICVYMHRFLFEFAKYIHRRCPLLNV